jgi:hypothetical protein
MSDAAYRELSTLSCIRQVLLDRQLIDPEFDLLEQFFSADPQRRAVSNQDAFAVSAAWLRDDYNIAAEARSGLRGGWGPIHRALQAGQQPIVLVSGRHFKTLFPGFRVWTWPWQSVLVTGVEQRGLLRYVCFYDPGHAASGERRLPVFVFASSRAKGQGAVMMWRYIWLRVPDVRERVPYPNAYLLIGP